MATLQMAAIYSAVANGGTLYEPHMAKAVVSPGGEVVHQDPPKVNGRLPAERGNPVLPASAP